MFKYNEIEGFPDELLHLILSFLTYKDISRRQSVNRNIWNRIQNMINDGKLTSICFSNLIKIGIIKNKSSYREQKIFCTHCKKENILYLVLEYQWILGPGKRGGNYYMECLVYDLASKKIIKRARGVQNKEKITSDRIYLAKTKKNCLLFEMGDQRNLMEWNIDKNVITPSYYVNRPWLGGRNNNSFHCPYQLKENFEHSFVVKQDQRQNKCLIIRERKKRLTIEEICIDFGSGYQRKRFAESDSEITLQNETVRSCHFADENLFIFSTVNKKTKANDQVIWRTYENCDLHKKYSECKFELEGTYVYHYFFPTQALLLIGYRRPNKTFCLVIYSFNQKDRKLL